MNAKTGLLRLPEQTCGGHLLCVNELSALQELRIYPRGGRNAELGELKSRWQCDMGSGGAHGGS